MSPCPPEAWACRRGRRQGRSRGRRWRRRRWAVAAAAMGSGGGAEQAGLLRAEERGAAIVLEPAPLTLAMLSRGTGCPRPEVRTKPLLLAAPFSLNSA